MTRSVRAPPPGLAAMAATWLCLSGAPAAAASAPGGAAGLSLFSHNIRIDVPGQGWARRNAPILATIADGRFDLVLIQEAVESQIPSFYKALPGYHAVIGERSDGHRGQGFYEYNPIFYRADRFDLVGKSSFWVADDPTASGATLAATKPHGRVITWVRLHERATGRQLVAINVHIHPQRVEDALKLILREVGFQGATVVMAGDFNAKPDNPGLAWLTGPAGPGFRDARVGAGRVEGPEVTVLSQGEHSWDSGDRIVEGAGQGARLDYVFTCGLPSADRFAVLKLPLAEAGGFASDHYAVTAGFTGRWAPCREQIKAR